LIRKKKSSLNSSKEGKRENGEELGDEGNVMSLRERGLKDLLPQVDRFKGQNQNLREIC